MLVRFLAQHPLGDLLGSDALPGETHEVANLVARALIGMGVAEAAEDFEVAPPNPKREAAARKGAPERAARTPASKRG